MKEIKDGVLINGAVTIAGSLPLPTGAATEAKQDTMVTALQLIDDTVATATSSSTTKVLQMGGDSLGTATKIQTDAFGQLYVVAANDFPVQELPTAATATDNTANPSISKIGSYGMLFDGSTWDRMPGNSTDGLLVNLGTNNDVTVSNTVNVDTGPLDSNLVTGTITAYDTVVSTPTTSGTVSGTPTANSYVAANATGYEYVTISIYPVTPNSIDNNGLFHFEASENSTNGVDGDWHTFYVFQSIGNTSLSRVNSSGGYGIFIGAVQGAKYIRIREKNEHTHNANIRITLQPAVFDITQLLWILLSHQTALSNIQTSVSKLNHDGGPEETAIRVTVANDSTGVLSVDDNGSTLSIDDGGSSITIDGTVTVTDGLNIEGDIAHDTADSGNPLKIGAKAIAHGTNPTAVAAGDRTDLYANRHGVLFTVGGHPNVVTVRNNYTAAQTDTALITVSGGTKIVVTRCTVTVDKATTVDVAVRIGFGATTTPTGTGVVLSHPGIAAGSGVREGNGGGILGIGADGEDLRITSEVPTTGSIDVVVTYYTIES